MSRREIKETTCDICGASQSHPDGWVVVSYCKWRQETQDICPAHSIQVTHNGDHVTLKKGTDQQ